MGTLLLLFILVPAAELALLLEVGSRIGTLPTLAIIVFTGVLGAFLARRQGLAVIGEAQARIGRGEIPASSLADGVMILVAAALLMTPGLLTDSFGFLLLVPAFRNVVKAHALRKIQRAVEENRLHVHVESDPFGSRPGAVYEARPESLEPDAETQGPTYKIH